MKPIQVSFVALLLAVSACASDTSPGANPGTSAAPKLELKATSGGPSGWTVRYTAVASGFSGPVQYDFSSCGASDAKAGELLEGNTLTCHHFEPGAHTVSVRADDAAGVVATDSTVVTIGRAEVPYEGTWRWTLAAGDRARDGAEGARSGYFTITSADIYTKGSSPFEFASRGANFECSVGSCKAAGAAAIFFSQTGLAQPPYAFNLRVDTLSPSGNATFDLSPEGQQRFTDGQLEVVKVSSEIHSEQGLP